MKNTTHQTSPKDESILSDLFYLRDKSPEIFFNFEVSFLPQETEKAVPINKQESEKFSDASYFRLNISLPLNYSRYTLIEYEGTVNPDFSINSPEELQEHLSSVLWFEFSQYLLPVKEDFLHVKDYLNYHYNWYTEKGGNGEKWLSNFEFWWAKDSRIYDLEEAATYLENGITSSRNKPNVKDLVGRSFPRIWEDVREWIAEKKNKEVLSPNFAPLEKINFYENASGFTYIIRQLVDLGLVRMPMDANDNDKVKALIEQFLNHFTLKDPETEEDLNHGYTIEYLSESFRKVTVGKAKTNKYYLQKLDKDKSKEISKLQKKE